MKCVVTAGPTYERLDEVRRITNFSTGRLGTELSNYLTRQGHQVALLVGEMATWKGPREATEVATFSTTQSLAAALRDLGSRGADAVFHAAAVSDFSAGRSYQRGPDGELTELKAGKLTTCGGSLLVELVPTPKIIASLREWFPDARLVGWKYEVDRKRDDVIARACRQMADCRTDACVANGPAYGLGFGLVTPKAGVEHYRGAEALFAALHQLISAARR